MSEYSERDTAMDLLRLIGMVLIVGSHIVGHCVFQIYGGSDADFEFYRSGGD